MKVSALIACLLAIVILAPKARSERVPRCGDELRVVTQDGDQIRGKLIWNSGDSLALSIGRFDQYAFAYDDLLSTDRVKRHTGVRFVVGALVGTGIGILIARDVNNREPPTSIFSDGFGKAIDRSITITIGSGLIGAVVGAVIGHNTPSYKKVSLRATPVRNSQYSSSMPTGVSLAINF